MTRTNFTECALRYFPLNQTMIDLYGYDGPIQGIPRNRSMQITLRGCKALCGTGVDWYSWSQASGTLTTWIFPIVGVVLQAPFVSNALWETVFSLARWIGSPMASLSYVLWNIAVSGKCTTMVDMSVPYNEKNATRHSDFGSIRDSFYLLSTMNQYIMRSKVRQKKEAEGLLRIALFSKDLRLLTEIPKALEPILAGPRDQSGLTFRVVEPGTTAALEPDGHLNKLRQDLAEELRVGRKRGVVPVYISTAWFLFSLGLSIQSAFGLLGENAEAHDLALGCLLAWLPVLILCTVVDRNPVSADEIKAKLNALVDRVRVSLMDDTIKAKYLSTIQNREQQDQMHRWVERISKECYSLENFFVDFAGQGRVRWHYGCCHPIIKDIERAYIAGEGRDWLCSEQEARTLLVLGDVTGGLDWFDYRELWQIVLAVGIVGGTIFGAFVLSFFTPTVGLGCRSGGYVIFGTNALGLLTIEMLAWWAIDAQKPHVESFLRRATIRRPAIASRWEHTYMRMASWKRAAARHLNSSASTVSRTVVPARMRKRFHDEFQQWQALDIQRRLDYILKLAEIINSLWLAYITIAQTFGVYSNCDCITSSWGGKNYMDFNQYSTTSSKWVRFYWISGTVVSVTVMGLAMIYIVTEWCMQSHLSTADFNKAASGLQLTRQFRFWFARDLIPMGFDEAWQGFRRMLTRFGLAGNPPRPRGQAKSLKWTKNVTCRRAEHDHRRQGSSRTEQEARQEQDTIPLIRAEDTQDIPLVDQPSIAHLHEHSSGAPSPRSSYDRSTGPSGLSDNYLFPSQRATYERRYSNSDVSLADEHRAPLQL